MKRLLPGLILMASTACAAQAPAPPAAEVPPSAAVEVPPEDPPEDPMAGLDVRTRPWPGRMPPEQRAPLEAEADAMVTAMNRGDRAAIARHRASLINRMGRYLGEPEEPPRYGGPINRAPPDRAQILQIWNAGQDRRAGRFPWQDGAAATKAGRAPPRLRETTRLARAELHIDESAAPRDVARISRVIEAADYLLEQQAENGVFGYPYDASATIGPRGGARRYIEDARKRGIELVANGWMVEDLGNGALNFDNAQSGLFLIHAFLATADRRYLAAAKRAGEWAKGRKLVSNFNYNGFNGQLLARLYRVTREPGYLMRAKEIFELGVLPGQLENGRWFDQHNAKIQYHAILMSQLAEFYLALDLARDPLAEQVRASILRGLDNLATEITTHGSSNVHELLAVDALVVGSFIFGERPLWRDAINVDMNFLVDHFAERLRERGRALPEPVGLYLLYAYGPQPGAAPVDARRGQLAAGRR